MKVASPKTVDQAKRVIRMGFDETVSQHQYRLYALEYVKRTGEVYMPLAMKYQEQRRKELRR